MTFCKKITKLMLACVLSWTSLLEAAAVDMYEPEFEHYEPPARPSNRNWSPAGLVRITFDVESSGSVVNLVIEQSTHASLTAAVKRAVPLWKFKPWTPSAYAPRQISDMRNLIFGRGWESDRQVNQARTRLRGVSCTAFNKARRERRSRLSVNEAFALDAPALITDLILEAVGSNRLKYYEGVETMDLFDRSKPEVEDACLDRPDKRYVEVLPDKLRQVVLDVSL
nr:energy transducer TonB [uncultured Pseudomonas sp.]